MKKRYLALFGLLGILILVGLLLFYEDDLNKNYACVKHGEFILESWKGVVDEKYIDSSNHNAETIKLTSQIVHAMFRDGTEFFKFIEVGDFLVKNLNTDTIKVYRADEIHRFKICFGCDD